MPYCPYCGRQVSEDMSFCPGCGAALSSEIKSYNVSQNIVRTEGNYKIYIAGKGSASESEIIDLLEDVMGYTTTSAYNLVRNIPVQIAENLSLQQAAVIAQAFEEYGVELTVTNGDEYEDITDATPEYSIFNSDGSFISSAAIILATLSASNRLRKISKPKKPSLLERLFYPRYIAPPRRRPVHIRRTIRPRNMDFRTYDTRPRRPVRQQIYPSGKQPVRMTDVVHTGSVRLNESVRNGNSNPSKRQPSNQRKQSSSILNNVHTGSPALNDRMNASKGSHPKGGKK